MQDLYVVAVWLIPSYIGRVMDAVFYFLFFFPPLGTLKIWNKNTGACLHTNRSLCEEKTEEGKTIITQALYSEVLGKVVIAMYDHNILFLNADFSYYKQV